MKFKNVKLVNNKLEFNVEASDQEVEYLVTFAVEQLMQEGILSINSYPEEQEVDLKGVTH